MRTNETDFNKSTHKDKRKSEKEIKDMTKFLDETGLKTLMTTLKTNATADVTEAEGKLETKLKAELVPESISEADITQIFTELEAEPSL